MVDRRKNIIKRNMLDLKGFLRKELCGVSMLQKYIIVIEMYIEEDNIKSLIKIKKFLKVRN